MDGGGAQVWLVVGFGGDVWNGGDEMGFEGGFEGGEGRREEGGGGGGEGVGGLAMDERDGDRDENSSCNTVHELKTKGGKSWGLGIGMINGSEENRILEGTAFWGWR